MSRLLDTNACIRYLNGTSLPLKAKLDAADSAQIVVCSVVKAELYFGAARSREPMKTLARINAFLAPFRSLPFDDEAAEAYARIRADLTSRGTLIGPNDLLIASVCIARGVMLVTNNVSEFSRVSGLMLEDWESAAS